MSHLRRLRAAVGPRKILVIYASALIRDPAGRILLQRRADFGDAWWGLPGGVLEPGETIGQCVRREAAEETGLRVEPVRLTGLYSSPRYDVRYPNGDLVQQVTACFDCRPLGGEPQADGGETLECRFFDPTDLPPLPLWYADMVAHGLAGGAEAYFDEAEMATDDGRPATDDRGPTTAVRDERPATNDERPPSSFVHRLSSREAVGPRSSVLRPETDYIPWLRQFVGRSLIVSAGAAAIVRDDRGRVLLVKRRDFGVWGMPAGAMNLGETLADTAARETREETGLDVQPTRLRAVVSGWRVNYPNGDSLDVFSTWFDSRIVGGRLRPDGQESTDAGFFPLDALPPLVPGLADRLVQVLSGSEGACFE